MRDEVKFKGDMRKDALLWGILFVVVMRMNVLFHGAFLISGMGRRLTYPLIFGASCFATYPPESGTSLFHNTLIEQMGAEFEHPFGRIVHHSYLPE